jgi:hypothetical protein
MDHEREREIKGSLCGTMRSGEREFPEHDKKGLCGKGKNLGMWFFMAELSGNVGTSLIA